MDVALSLINSYIPDKYSKHAEKEDTYKGNPCVSFPVKLSDVPEDVKSLACTLIDYDTVPDIGFAWIHWIAANLTPSDKIAEDISRTDGSLVQGENSFSRKFTDEEITCSYIGPEPPDEDHHYTFSVYALDTILDLKKGYSLDEFYKAIEDHVLAKTQTQFLARP